MKDISLTKFGIRLHFKKLSAEELRQSGSFNLVDDDGKFVGILVIPASAFKRTQIQNIADAGNAALGLM